MSETNNFDAQQSSTDRDDLLDDPAETPIQPDLYEERPLWKRILLWFVPNLTAFMASFCIMVLELVAGRVIARYLGSSLYTWTSVIGIVLAGITIGNFLGGRLADWFKPSAVLAVVFLVASAACFSIPWVNTLVYNWEGWSTEPAKATGIFWLLGEAAGAKDHLPWSARIFGHVLFVFLLPSTLLGMIGPVVAKMALDQGRRVGKTVGNVYAWGAMGSIVGTFITGFYLINWLGTEPIVWGVAGVLGFIGILYSLGRFWPYAPPAAALIALVFMRCGLPFEWVEHDGRTVLREKTGKDELYIEESDYCYIKIDRQKRGGKESRRDLVMDSLIHAELVPDNATDLQYEYEKIYQALTHRFAPVAPTGKLPAAAPAEDEAPLDGPAGEDEEEAKDSGGNGGIAKAAEKAKDPEKAEEKAAPGNGDSTKGRPACLFLGGGGYVFPRYIRAVWPDSYIEVAEIDPAVTAADVAEFGLDKDSIQIVESAKDLERTDNPMWIYHMDARNHVEDLSRKLKAGEKVQKFDYVYGDAFNFLGVPFHLTTQEFDERVRDLLTDNGIYMVNVIDIFKHGHFVGAVTNTFRKVFDNVYVLCTNDREPDMRDNGRDTFIVVGSRRPLDLSGLPGAKAPYEFTGCVLTDKHLADLEKNTLVGGTPLVLTDSHAPVENLLEPVVNRWKLRD